MRRVGTPVAQLGDRLGGVEISLLHLPRERSAVRADCFAKIELLFRSRGSVTKFAHSYPKPDRQRFDQENMGIPERCSYTAKISEYRQGAKLRNEAFGKYFLSPGLDLPSPTP